MITSIEFKEKWNELESVPLKPISINKLNGFHLQPETVDFLANASLPDGAAPFLSFFQGTATGRGGIQPVKKAYPYLGPEFDHYVYIGFCDDADPIVINPLNNDQIEILLHEDSFKSEFLNTSLYSLAECLLIYRDFIRLNMEENGHGNYFTDEQFEEVKQKITAADPKAAQLGFWKNALAVDLLMRDEYIKVRL